MEKTYYATNAARSIHTRLVRLQSPERPRFKQFILGGSTRLVRNRPVPISEAQLKEHFEELNSQVKKGAIRIFEGRPDGPLVDMSILDPNKVEAAKVAEPVNNTPVKASEPKKPKDEKKELSIDDMPPPPPAPTSKKSRKKKKG